MTLAIGILIGIIAVTLFPALLGIGIVLIGVILNVIYNILLIIGSTIAYIAIGIAMYFGKFKVENKEDENNN